MVLVENISVILEDTDYILYVNTLEGIYIEKIEGCWAEQLQKALVLDINMKKQWGDISITQCELLWEQNNFTASIELNKSYQGRWEEALCMALALEVPIYIDSKVLMTDYCVDDEAHELFVQELLDKEQKYWNTTNAMKFIQKKSKDATEKSVSNYNIKE